MPLTVTSKRLNAADEGGLNALGQREYKLSFIVDQTDAGALADGIAMTLAAQALVGAGRVPEIGEEFVDFTTDLDSYCQQITWKRIEFEKHLFTRWLIECAFGPATNTDPGVFTESNPLSWPVIYDVDWIEEQVPLEQAAIVENLSHVGRAANSVGPVINSCGIEFTEGLLKTIYYPVLIALKNYEFLEDIIALNLTYQNTTNNGTYFDASARKAKYLSTASGGRQQANGQVYYPGTTRIWFKDITWDRKVLNNGWGHFKKTGGSYIEDDASKPKLFKNKVHDDPDADPDAEPTADCSEPLNLDTDGTLLATDAAAEYLTFRDLAEVDYSGIGIGS